MNDHLIITSFYYLLAFVLVLIAGSALTRMEQKARHRFPAFHRWRAYPRSNAFRGCWILLMVSTSAYTLFDLEPWLPYSRWVIGVTLVLTLLFFVRDEVVRIQQDPSRPL